MAEYIEREAFVESQHNIYCVNCNRRKDSKGRFVYFVGDAPCRACGIMDVLDAVEDFPAADVRPVVLCRDCKHSDTFAPDCTEATFPLKCLSIRYGGVYPNWFCEHGEKREES